MEFSRKIMKLIPNLSVISNQIWKPPPATELKTSFAVHNIEQVRNRMRQFFPRPSERKRLKKHGYETRLKTPGGRAIIMRRILKGRFVLSH